MKSIIFLVNQFKNNFAASIEYEVDNTQLRRLVNKGAFVDEETGQVYIPSKTVLKIKVDAVCECCGHEFKTVKSDVVECPLCGFKNTSNEVNND